MFKFEELSFFSSLYDFLTDREKVTGIILLYLKSVGVLEMLEK